MNISKLILAVAVVSLAGCGGGSSSTSSSGVQKIVDHSNQAQGTFKVNNLNLKESNSERSVYTSCLTISESTREDLPEDVSSEYSNGACFEDSSQCMYVTNDALLSTTILTRTTTVVTPQKNISESFINNGFAAGLGVFRVSAGQKVSNCDDSMPVEIPVIDGVYEGHIYKIDSDKTIDKQALIQSSKITLDCSNSLCTPRDENEIVLFSTGLDMSPVQSSAGPYILTSFSIPDKFKRFQFWGTASDDGSTITGLAYPLSTDEDFVDCYNGSCFSLEFHKTL